MQFPRVPAGACKVSDGSELTGTLPGSSQRSEPDGIEIAIEIARKIVIGIDRARHWVWR